MKRTISGLILGTALALTMTGCATTRESARASAMRLDDRASQFYSQIRYEGDDSRANRVSRDAQSLAASSHDLSRALSRDEPRDRAEREFDRVAHDYQELHDHLADEGYADQNRRLLQDFDRVTEAFRSVENSMGYRRSDNYERRDRDYARN